MHVYIEGDGRPWQSRYTVSVDPTPDKPLMLELMLMDPSPALYLGRPCYFRLQDPACSAIWWTHQRYAAKVVDSMNTVLDRYTDAYTHIQLMGHSGGGTLAMLMASTRRDVNGVVTLAGNLDIERWSALHNYSPLQGSMNPANHPVSPTIQQGHYVGQEDTTTPPDFIRSSLKLSPLIKLEVIEGVSHNCCWQPHWPRILDNLMP